VQEEHSELEVPEQVRQEELQSRHFMREVDEYWFVLQDERHYLVEG